MHYMIIVYSPTYLHKLYMTCSRYTFNHLLSNNIRNLCQTMHIKRKKSTNNSFCPIRTEHKFNYISNVAEKNHYIRILMVKCTRKARRSVAPQQHFISCDVAQYPSLFNSPHSRQTYVKKMLNQVACVFYKICFKRSADLST